MGTDYQHGIFVGIAPTVMPVANLAEAGVQVVVGTAPVNMLANPAAAVNVPLLLNSLADASSLLAYNSDIDLDNYTIGQAIHATMEVFNTAPLVAINVLDPAKHTTTGKTSNGNMVNGVFTPTDKGIMLNTLVVKDGTGATTYVLGTDYTASWNSDGSLSITTISTGAITASEAIETTYSILDPTLVTAADIVSGIATIDRVFQAVNVIPEVLLAPGWSQQPTVAAALIAKCPQVSTVFKASAVVDLDCAVNLTPAEAIAWKSTNGYISRDAIYCYPKVTTNQGKVIWMSAQLAALMQTVDAQNDSTPFVSPSNKSFNILGSQLADGTAVLWELEEANQLNGEGIVTALNFQRWVAWGNNTGFYSWTAAQAGTVYQPQDQWIPIKRGFDWQANRFIVQYFTNVDNPTNYRAIQTLITDENRYYGPFITAGMVAGMAIYFNQAVNPISQILEGTIQFQQSLTPFPPMQAILNTLQFDPAMLQTALGGGS